MATQERVRGREEQRENPGHYYDLYERNEWHYVMYLFYWWICLSTLGFLRDCGKSLSISGTRWAMIAFHRFMFATLLLAVFIKGGIDEGRKELLAELFSRTILTMTLKQLTDLEVS
jgi:hypothetical protein